MGEGSVRTRAWILLMEPDDGAEPLMLQAKAQTTVLAPNAGGSDHENQGQRVVVGQRLMQAVSDVFLGWQRRSGIDARERGFHPRQLRDWKLGFPSSACCRQAWRSTRGRLPGRWRERTPGPVSVA